MAAIELLARPLARSGRLAMMELLERARAPTWRVWAENAPFDMKNVLKARGYRWNGDANGKLRAWYIDVADAHREAEISFLSSEIYRREVALPIFRVDAYSRFSERA